MSETSTLGVPDAARRLGVSVRMLRGAIRSGKLPAPPQLTATTPLSAEWLDRAEAALAAEPGAFIGAARQKIPAFVRYRGTSAWHKDTNRRRAYARFRTGTEQAKPPRSSTGG